MKVKPNKDARVLVRADGSIQFHDWILEDWPADGSTPDLFQTTDAILEWLRLNQERVISALN